MSEERSIRKLAAIVSADAVGYSRLIRADEAGTRAALNRHFGDIFEPEIARRGGRVVKTVGDGLLAEFPSVVEAVEAAVAIQAAMARENDALPADRRMDFRIGINLGDVIVEGDDIHGDGVNVAARLESLAETGGICVSASVREHVRHVLAHGFEDMGPRQVKNIAEPIAAFRLLAHDGDASAKRAPAPGGLARRSSIRLIAAGLALVLLAGGGVATWWTLRPEMTPARAEAMAFPLPDKPSIAVLPLANVSGDPDQAYFADGLTEELVTRLAGLPSLFVIARNSTEKYRGEGVDIRDVAQDLGVQYVLEGSARRSGEALRVSVRLIDALKGAHVWAQTYDGPAEDVFAVQDEITGEVVSRLASSVVSAEFRRQSAGGTRDLEAYDLFLRGWHGMQVLHQRSNLRGIELFEQAIARDPHYARAYAGLAIGRAQNVRFRWGDGPDDTFEAALAAARRATELAPTDEFVLRGLCSTLRLKGDYGDAIEACEKALLRSPDNPNVLISLAFAQALAGHGAEAAASAELALRGNPYPQPGFYSWRGVARFVNGDFEAAIEDMERFRSLNPELIVSYQWLAAMYGALGRLEQAGAMRDEVLARTGGRFSIDGFLRDLRPRGLARQRIVEGMVNAGFPPPAEG